MISDSASSLKNLINMGDPNNLPDQFRQIKLGNVLRSQLASLVKQVPAANAYNLGTVLCIALPDDAKASQVTRAYARAAGAASGELVVDAYAASAAPASGHVSVTANGDIQFLAADAATLVDVMYQPAIYEVMEFTLPVTVGVLTLPTVATTPGVLFLMEAEALAATVTGKKIILTPAAGLPATTKAQLNIAKTTVSFNNGTDVVTSARVKVAVAPGTDINALLGANSALA